MRPPRRDAVAHDALVEFAEIELLAASGRVVAAKLERREFAEKVAAVGRIVGAAHCFLPRRGRREMSLALEELRRLVDGPLAAVQPQSGDQPADARERLADLCESITRIVGLETFFADQLPP